MRDRGIEVSWKKSESFPIRASFWHKDVWRTRYLTAGMFTIVSKWYMRVSPLAQNTGISIPCFAALFCFALFAVAGQLDHIGDCTATERRGSHLQAAARRSAPSKYFQKCQNRDKVLWLMRGCVSGEDICWEVNEHVMHKSFRKAKLHWLPDSSRNLIFIILYVHFV